MINKKLSRHDDLSSEVKKVRKLEGKVNIMEGSFARKDDFDSSIAKFRENIDLVKKSLITDKNFEKYVAGLKIVEKKLAVLEDFAVEAGKLQDAIAKSKKPEEKYAEKARIEELSKKLSEFESAYPKKASVEDEISRMKREISEVNNTLSQSVSEVDLSEYITKKVLAAKLSVVDALAETDSRLEKEISGIEKEIVDFRRQSATVEDVSRLNTELKSIAKAIDSMKASLDKISLSNQKKLESSIEKVNQKIDRSMLKTGYELKKNSKPKAVSSGEGFLSRVSKVFSDFFREDDVKPEKNERFDVKDYLEKKSEKKENDFNWPVAIGVVSAIAILAVLLFLLVSFERQPAGSEDGIEDSPQGGIVDSEPSDSDIPDDAVEAQTGDISGAVECVQMFECKERANGEYWYDCHIDTSGTCRCFIDDGTRCGISEEESVLLDSRSNAPYLIGAAILLAGILAVYALTGKGDGKQKDGNGEEKVNLNEFFQKK